MKECIKKNIIMLITTMVFSVLASIALVGVSVLMQKIIDCATSGDIGEFKKALIITIIYCLGMGILFLTYDISGKIFSKNYFRMLKEKVFSGILKKNYKDFTSNNTSDYLSVLLNDMKLIEENYVVALLQIVQNIVLFIGTIILLIYFSPLVAVCLFICMIAMFVIPQILGNILENKQKDLSEELSLFTGKLKDIFLGYDVIRSFGIKNHIIKEFNEEDNKLVNVKFIVDKLIVINNGISQMLGTGTQVVAIFVSTYLVIKGEITMGALMGLVQLSGTLVQPVIVVMSNIPKINSMKSVIERINKFYDYQDDINNKGSESPTFENYIDISNLSFGYTDERETLKGINLKIEKNKRYAIVGGSGSGKSTLIKLMLGYYSDFGGQIKYDGKELKKLNLEQLNKMIAIIHQNIYMFDKDIKSNICLYDKFSDKELNEALEQSGVNRFVESTTNGIEYLVGENGCNLSGGQKQRIAIARALIQKTPILVLDEGTSAIDMQTAYEVEKGLLGIKELTLIAITHKLTEELLDLYDEIIYMDNGCIVEKGSLKALLDKKGDFYNFYNLCMS